MDKMIIMSMNMGGMSIMSMDEYRWFEYYEYDDRDNDEYDDGDNDEYDDGRY